MTDDPPGHPALLWLPRGLHLAPPLPDAARADLAALQARLTAPDPWSGDWPTMLASLHPAEVLPLIAAFLRLYPDAEFGPGHIVLSDWNLLDHNLAFAAGECAGPYPPPVYSQCSEASYYATRVFLAALALIPESVREAAQEAAHGALFEDAAP